MNMYSDCLSESSYRHEIQHRTQDPNASESKEITIDLRKPKRTEHTDINIERLERVDCFRYLGVNIRAGHLVRIFHLSQNGRSVSLPVFAVFARSSLQNSSS